MNKELIERLRKYHDTDLECGGFGVQEAVDAADALEAADKRIAELEAELQKRAKQIGVACMTHDLTHSLACGRCLTEAERNLAVAREALKEVIAWSQLRTIENVSAEPDLVGECVPKTDAASYCLSPASQDV